MPSAGSAQESSPWASPSRSGAAAAFGSPPPRPRGGGREPLGRGGGLRLAASRRREEGPVLALNGDELLDVDFPALLAEHGRARAAATIVVSQVRSPFGVVDLEDNGRVTGFREGPLLDDWVNSGVYML